MLKQTLYRVSFLVTAILLLLSTSCKRSDIAPLPDPIAPVVPVDDQIQVIASVAGIVLDESNMPVPGALVTSGTAIVNTNTLGMFKFDNISLSKNNGSVTVTKVGYFKGVRSFKTTAGKSHQVKIQLMQKVLSGTINASTGGNINSNGGATITFPANAFVTSTGASFSGTVNVCSRWIDPTAANLPFIVPGDLRGIGTNGAENILETYGMVGAELEDVSGNVLKIAVDKKAIINFPIPAGLLSTAPAEIVLWHFDDVSVRWKENGKAIKSGNNYTAQVDKFSFWNCDVASTFIMLDYTLINAFTNTPLVATSTRIKIISIGNFGYGITNNEGFVSGLVPGNELLALEVLSTCGTVIYSQNIGPFSVNKSLGNINVNLPSSQYINFSGTLLNCNSAPVSNGYISFYGSGGNSIFANTNAAGGFSFSIPNCGNNNITYSYTCFDNSTSTGTALFTGSASNGMVNLGNITVCPVVSTADIYVAGFELIRPNVEQAKIWKNGIATNLTAGTRSSVATSVYVSGSDIYVAGYEYNSAFKFVAKFWKNGIATDLTNNNTYDNFATSIYVSGSDIYVAGYENNLSTNGTYSLAKYWKNGIAVNLTNGTTYNAVANSVFVSAGDIYVAGFENNAGSTTIAKLWKNGVATSLSISYGKASSVYVSGTDVYVAGWELNPASTKFVAKVWKNGVATNLTTGAFDAEVYSVFVSGTDIYATGWENNSAAVRVAKVWKNGLPTSLTNGSYVADGRSVCVLGNDVYVSGRERNNITDFIPKIWKNGVSTNLTNGTPSSCGMSIFVK